MHLFVFSARPKYSPCTAENAPVHGRKLTSARAENATAKMFAHYNLTLILMGGGVESNVKKKTV